MQKENLYKIVPIIETIMKSKKNQILNLFFNEPTRQWHFEEILTHTKMSRSKASVWLRKFIKEKLIIRIKKNGKMPYYLSSSSPQYQTKKRIFALEMLHDLITHLMEIKEAKTIILFGSFSRSDWYKGSDIDIFIFGNPHQLSITDYEVKLKREIQLFIYEDEKKLKSMQPGLMKNIIKGNIIKGDIDFLRVEANA